MNFSEFAKMLYPYLGKGAEIPGYVLRLIDLIMENPFDEVSVKEDMNDKYNPLSSVSLNLLNKIYNGERKISRKKASVISSHFTREKLIDAINGLPIDAQTQLCVSLRKKGIEAEENTVDECCADLVGKILQELTFGVKEVKTASEPNIIGIDAFQLRLCMYKMVKCILTERQLVFRSNYNRQLISLHRSCPLSCSFYVHMQMPSKETRFHVTKLICCPDGIVQIWQTREKPIIVQIVYTIP